MVRKILVTLAVGGALLASVAYADVVRPGDVRPATAEKAPPPSNWVFGTYTGDPFYDDFESYPLGEVCGLPDPGNTNPIGLWDEWDGSVDVCGHVVDGVLCDDGSANQSLELRGDVGGQTGLGDDTIHRFDIVGDVWTVTADIFVPQNATGSTYWLLLADYPPHGGFNWATQVRIDADLDIVESEWGTSFDTPLIRGRWVEMKTVINMPEDTQDYYYDGVLFDEGQSWTNRVGSPNGKSFRAIDLYANEPPSGTTGTFIDNVCVRRAGDPPCTECGGEICVAADMDCNGVVDALDIEPFICLLFVPGCEPCSPCAGDIDGNGVVDALDIEPFINILFP